MSGKRKVSQAVQSSVLDDELTHLKDSIYQETDDYSTMAIKKLQKKTANEKRIPRVPPYREWPEGAKLAHEHFIAQAMKDIETFKIVRPADPELLEKFRRVEASNAVDQGVASLSIYDARRPDPTYARNPLGTADTPKRIVSGPIEHTHDKETTRIAEMRAINGLDKKRRISDEDLCSEGFCDACIPEDCQKALHGLGTYVHALRFKSKIAKQKNKTNSLHSFICTIRLECAMPLFCVRFLHDATLEICLHMETNATYFAVFTFAFDEYVLDDAKKRNISKEEALRSLKNLVCEEIAQERKKSEKRLDETASLLRAPIESLSTDQLRQRAQIQRDDKEFRSLVDRFHVRFDEAKPDNAQEVAIAAYEAVGVFAIEKSPALLAIQCKFLYVYFATCQCLMDIPDASTSTNTIVVQTSAVKPRTQHGSSTIIDGLSVSTSSKFDFTKTYAQK